MRLITRDYGIAELTSCRMLCRSVWTLPSILHSGIDHWSVQSWLLFVAMLTRALLSQKESVTVEYISYACINPDPCEPAQVDGPSLPLP